MDFGGKIHSPRSGRHFFRVVVPTGFAALGLALAACGSTGSSSSGAAAGPKLDPSAYVLTSGSAATNGYKAEPNTDTTESTAFQDPVPKCMHLSSGDLGPASTAHANGDMFSDDDGTAIESGARVFGSADTVTRHVDLVHRADFPNCLAQAVMGELSKSGGMDGATVRSATAAPPPAGVTALTRIVFNVSASGSTVQVNVDLISIFRGRVESVILVVNPLTQASPDTLTALSGQVVGKLANQ
ncbi:hypothetical protein [Pseudofrankia inefficax]|uniref:Lipoprotein n=1 Tax=Pseudofrankia inefficax (strain DSM 45817 / CECT 9037 / DDB 130130 / EuI1c) TaxID=298654 RepID=E3J610_PSEI1|nr:hypothetical protein [Pseudofrankia inefficax]ADP78301.1 hypothetical protein FraEuI1c_0213 [Pseudofrankia inefficax]